MSNGLHDIWKGKRHEKLNYFNGKLNGLCEAWYKHNKLFERNYHNGEYHGLVKNYNNGVLCEERNYDNGLLHGISRFHVKGITRYYLYNKEITKQEYDDIQNDIHKCFNIQGVSNITIGYFF